MKLISGKHYYLYLDESGDFEENEETNSFGHFKEPSLVGGIFGPEDLNNTEIPRSIISDVRKKYISQNHEYSKSDFRHAVDLPSAIKKYVKLDMVEAIVKAGFTPVIFQQKTKELIQDNTTTYIMFLVDGLIKLIQDCIFDYDLKLTVVIGNRKNVDKMNRLKDSGHLVKKYENIKPNEITNEFYKYLAMAKIRESYSFPHKFQVKFRFDDDKGNDFLVLSDYICNSYYTRNSFIEGNKQILKSRFQQFLSDGKTIDHRKFHLYSILEEPELERLKRNVSDGNYGEALFFAMILNRE